ncbi:MAG: translation initiation factor IF-2 [Clostridiales Family XIII bacterium]|jgi:translation initiation factor IF-2|nr:translation initiation factor IF-2 [Clostridiales Family XIII bacterium]
MKIHEIATEFRMQSKDVMKKAGELGIEAKNHMASLSDEDTKALIHALRYPAGGSESKISKVTPKAKASVKAVAETPEPAKTAGNSPIRRAKNAAEPVTDPQPETEKPSGPKRISREVLEAEAKAKEIDEVPEKISSEIETTVTATPRKKPILKVAFTDQASEDETSAPAPIAPERKAQGETAKTAVGAETSTASKAETAASEAAPSETTEKTEAPSNGGSLKPAVSTPTETAPANVTADPIKTVPAVAPTSAGTGKLATRSKQAAQNAPVAKAAGDGKEPVREGKEKEKGKNPDKKSRTQIGSESKSGNVPGEKGKKHSARPTGKRAPVEDFRGSKRSPILEDSSLEKRPTKSKNRSKYHTKNEPEITPIPEDLDPGTRILTVPITVAGFAEQTEKTNSEVIMGLMKLGIMANINQTLDETTVLLLGDELNVPVFVAKDEGEIIEEGIEIFTDTEEDLLSRPPIITVMGHVDHGKTSLLDAIRKTNVTLGEAGGITQHIGASEVTVNDQKIVFLDTPGHEAFTAMRARGAHITDIAVLVVAADDGVMPQTIESISHAKAAGVPIIVAINKMDKDGANPDRVRQELADRGILVEEWGGDTISAPVSAKTGEGIVNLLEMILLQAEVLELKANPNRLAIGTVIEARLDKSKGAVATLLVQNGTLKTGMSIVAGMASGHIRVMSDFAGKNIKTAGPSTAVEITGLSDVPQAGDIFNAVSEDKVAREIAEGRKMRQREEIMMRTSGASLETLFSQISANELKELNIIVKGDVQGSVGALNSSLEKLSNDAVRVHIIHSGVGTVTESDVMLAGTSNAVIIGFNVRPGSSVTALAEQSGVEIRTYRVIYDAINEIEAALKGMLDPEFREVVLGKVEIREIFKVPGAGVIGGAYVIEGKVQRNAQVRIVRDGIVIHEGKISSLRRFKDDVREVASGYECGIGIENFNDIKEGDIVEAFMMEEIERL